MRQEDDLAAFERLKRALSVLGRTIAGPIEKIERL
jgi:hypothetical protein